MCVSLSVLYILSVCFICFIFLFFFMSIYFFFFFFFSSRRRHTRCLSDWSSDVCSSDLDCHCACSEQAGTANRRCLVKKSIMSRLNSQGCSIWQACPAPGSTFISQPGDRKSTRLNSSHLGISYAVFCLKKKKKK